MKKLLNTLYVTTPDAYLSLDGENLVVLSDGNTLGRFPLHNFEAIICFGYIGASPVLMGKCAESNISLSFLKPNGKFLAKVTGKGYGNILLRKSQYRYTDDAEKSNEIAKNFIVGKLYNSKSVIDRALRDYPLRLDCEKLKKCSIFLKHSINSSLNATNNAQLRGFEGEAASEYFKVFNDLILQQKEDFCFNGRNRNPPLDNVNAMLSFSYTLLSGICCSALESVGLDPYEGFMHTDRPGRCSLALDLMEELRAPFADRFVLTAINKKIISADGFVQKENGSVIMNDDTRKAFLNAWQDKKKETITHPYLNQKVEWGIIPFVQAMLLARYIRGDIDSYPPFLWK